MSPLGSWTSRTGRPAAVHGPPLYSSQPPKASRAGACRLPDSSVGQTNSGHGSESLKLGFEAEAARRSAGHHNNEREDASTASASSTPGEGTMGGDVWRCDTTEEDDRVRRMGLLCGGRPFQARLEVTMQSHRCIVAGEWGRRNSLGCLRARHKHARPVGTMRGSVTRAPFARPSAQVARSSAGLAPRLTGIARAGAGRISPSSTSSCRRRPGAATSSCSRSSASSSGAGSTVEAEPHLGRDAGLPVQLVQLRLPAPAPLRRPGVRMVHRVDGPIGVYRGFDDGTDAASSRSTAIWRTRRCSSRA